MRRFLISSAAVLALCATTPAVLAQTAAPEADVHALRLPLNILRAEGQPPRMGEVYLQAGSESQASPFVFYVFYDADKAELGDPQSIGWTVRFNDYCRDRPGWVQSVVTGPSGQVWRGFRVSVPAGPDRMQNWSSGSSQASGPGAVATPGLLEAVRGGGRFTIALEDDEGRRWNPEVIDTLDPSGREQLYKANLEAVAAAPATLPVAGERLLEVRTQAPRTLPSPPNPCP
jgi:hypothetical protein